MQSNQKKYEKLLSGGHPNSLGNVPLVIKEINHNFKNLEILYLCYFSKDPVVRLRTSNVFKKVTLNNPQLFIPFIDRFINDISKIDQASTKWTIALLFDYSYNFMSKQQIVKAKFKS